MPGPLSPQEVVEAQLNAIPEIVFEVINKLLIERKPMRSSWFKITLEEFKEGVRQHPKYLEMIPPPNVFKEGWHRFEDHYRRLGWKVTYKTPSYDEEFEPYWAFES